MDSDWSSPTLSPLDPEQKVLVFKVQVATSSPSNAKIADLVEKRMGDEFLTYKVELVE